MTSANPPTFLTAVIVRERRDRRIPAGREILREVYPERSERAQDDSEGLSMTTRTQWPGLGHYPQE
jgi:hypothetical protein